MLGLSIYANVQVFKSRLYICIERHLTRREIDTACKLTNQITVFYTAMIKDIIYTLALPNVFSALFNLVQKC